MDEVRVGSEAPPLLTLCFSASGGGVGGKTFLLITGGAL